MQEREDALPKRLHRQAKAALHEIYDAETGVDADAGIDESVRSYSDKYPKATAKLTKDRDVLLTFYDFPAAHWIRLRTRTRSNRPSPPYGPAPGSPKAQGIVAVA